MSYWREPDSTTRTKPGCIFIFMKQPTSTSALFINISGFFNGLMEFLSTFLWISHYSPVPWQPQQIGLLRRWNLCLFITPIVTATCKHALSCKGGLSSLPSAFSPSSFLASIPPTNLQLMWYQFKESYSLWWFIIKGNFENYLFVDWHSGWVIFIKKFLISNWTVVVKPCPRLLVPVYLSINDQ